MEEKDLPTLRMIARIHSDFPDKFGIPREIYDDCITNSLGISGHALLRQRRISWGGNSIYGLFVAFMWFSFT